MIEADGHATIGAPAERVFDVVADPTNEPRWLPGAKAVEQITPGPVGLGTRFRGTYARAGTVSLEVVEFDRPRRVTLRAASRIVHFDDAIELRPDGDRTRLSAHMTARPRGLMRLVEPLMARTMRTQFQANWAHLATYVEGAR